MRLALLLLAAVAAGCSTAPSSAEPPSSTGGWGGLGGSARFIDTDGDGIPDKRVDGRVFLDTDGDGLPDQAVGTEPGENRGDRSDLDQARWAVHLASGKLLQGRTPDEMAKALGELEVELARARRLLLK